MLEEYPNHTYKIEHNGQVSVQNEKRLKLHTASSCLAGQAPTLSEPRKRPSMREATRVVDEEDESDSAALELLSTIAKQLLFAASPEPSVAVPAAENSVQNYNNCYSNSDIIINDSRNTVDNGNNNIGTDAGPVGLPTTQTETTNSESNENSLVATSKQTNKKWKSYTHTSISDRLRMR